MIIITIWLVLGLIGLILIFIDIKRKDEYVTMKDLVFGLIAILFGLVFLIYAMSYTKILEGFWDKKIF